MYEKFLKRIEKICKKPGMYLQNATYASVIAFIEGYTTCWIDAEMGDEDPLLYFPCWIRIEYEIHHPSWSWARIILHQGGSEKAAIELLPKLFRKFIGHISPGYSDRLKNTHDLLFKNQHKEPAETYTQTDLTFKSAPDL